MFTVKNWCEPQYGTVTVGGADVREAVLNLLKLLGDSRRIVQVVEKNVDSWDVQIQNGCWLVVTKNHQV